MSTLSKVLLGLILVAGIGLVYMSIRAYGTLKNYGENYQAHVDKLADLDAQLEQLRPTIARLQADMEVAALERGAGRVWYGAGSIDGEDVKVAVVGPALPPTPADEAEQASVLYVYETWDEGGKPEGESNILNYIGQFKVTFQDPAANNVTLAPTRALTDEEQATMEASVERQGVRWIMYEAMPADSYAILEGMDPEEFRSMFPSPDDENAASIASYLHHGEAADANDPDDRVMVSVKFLKNFDELTPNEIQYLRDSLPQSADDDRVEFESYTPIEYEQLVVKDEYLRIARATAELLTNPANMDPLAVEESPVDEAGNQEPARMYMRQLHDFDQIFRKRQQDLVQVASAITAAKFDVTRLQESITKLQAELDSSNATLAEAKGLRDHMIEERDLVEGVVAELQTKLEGLLAKADELSAENVRLAQELREAQIAAAQTINRRVGAQAQPVASGN